MAKGEINNWAADIQTLLGQSKVCFLATQGKHGPETSMAPFTIYHGTALLHLSKLARHTSNIEKCSSIGLMICTPEDAADSPLALPRLSLQGKATPVGKKEFESAKSAYLKVIPDAEPLFSFTDFRLFQFTPSSIHWVGGFGKARNISLEKWQNISHIHDS
jgi:hypothetical protein